MTSSLDTHHPYGLAVRYVITWPIRQEEETSFANDPNRESEIILENSSNISQESELSSTTSTENKLVSREEFIDPLSDPNMESFLPFIHDRIVSLNSDFSSSVPVKILRDTGSAQTFCRKH